MQHRGRAPAKRIARLAALLMGAPATLAALSDGSGASGDAEQLLVMLQGNDLAAIEASVLANGGVITHKLPIIRAVGARMSAAQLEQVKAGTTGIDRVIDDLAWEPEPDLPEAGTCPLKSSIELAWNATTARWVLYNKSSESLLIEGGELAWPAELGDLEHVRSQTAPLLVTPSSDEEQRVSWTAETPLAIPAESNLALEFEFTRAPYVAGATQSAIELTAKAGEDCVTELVPSYDLPLADSYYPSVSGVDLLHSNGITGEGITVAVLDSGLWEGHSELALNTRGEARVIARYNAITDREPDSTVDESGHGTHMSSVLARSGLVTRPGVPQPSYRGIAPDVSLVAVKAFGSSGKAGFLDIVRGIQWVVDNRERLNIRVLNLSFAARPRWPYWDDPVNQALMRAWQAGIFIAAAAGNEGPEPLSVGSPGNLPYLLTVGAVTDSWTESDRNDDYIPDFSSRGPTPMGHIKPDLVAMGGHISGIISPGATLAAQLPEYLLGSGEFVMTGTSQATALVSGLAALMLQLEPGLSNDELKCMLMTSAEPAIEIDGRLAYSPLVQGQGMVSLQRAMTLGERSCQHSLMDLEADIDGGEHLQGPAIFEDTLQPYLPGQEKLISDRDSEKGLSASRRWGAAEHLERLTRKPENSPIDWLRLFSEEQQRIEKLAGEQ